MELMITTKQLSKKSSPFSVLHSDFDDTTPRATAKAIAVSTPHTAIIVKPRSKADLLFHQVGFLKK